MTSFWSLSGISQLSLKRKGWAGGGGGIGYQCHVDTVSDVVGDVVGDTISYNDISL